MKLTASGTRILPVNISDNIELPLEAINLNVLAVHSLNTQSALWNLELEYQTGTRSQWKQLAHSHSVTVDVGRKGAFTSIQAAVEGVPPGGVVNIGPGHYLEDVHIAKPVVLRGVQGNGRAVVHGKVFIESSNVTVDGIQFSAVKSLTIVDAHFVTIQNCEFHGSQKHKFTAHSNQISSLLHVENSRNVKILNSIFSDCSLGLSIVNCSQCRAVGSTFTSCLTAVQAFSSESIIIMRNYFEQNLVALETDNFSHLPSALKENAFEKNSAMVKSSRLFSRTDLKDMFDLTILSSSDEQLLFFKPPAASSKVLVYGDCHAGSNVPSTNPCVYIRGEK